MIVDDTTVASFTVRSLTRNNNYKQQQQNGKNGTDEIAQTLNSPTNEDAHTVSVGVLDGI